MASGSRLGFGGRRRITTGSKRRRPSTMSRLVRELAQETGRNVHHNMRTMRTRVF